MNDLDPEEKELLASFDQGQWRSDFNPDRIHTLKNHAEATLAKDKRITIRISSRDLEELQVKAIEAGIPYQTLITSILHRYVSGGLIEG